MLFMSGDDIYRNFHEGPGPERLANTAEWLKG